MASVGVMHGDLDGAHIRQQAVFGADQARSSLLTKSHVGSGRRGTHHRLPSCVSAERSNRHTMCKRVITPKCHRHIGHLYFSTVLELAPLGNATSPTSAGRQN